MPTQKGIGFRSYLLSIQAIKEEENEEEKLDFFPSFLK